MKSLYDSFTKAWCKITPDMTKPTVVNGTTYYLTGTMTRRHNITGEKL